MDKQLTAPPLIRTIGKPGKPGLSDTYANLSTFVLTLPAGPARTQLERLRDSLGVEINAIPAREEDLREARRKEERAHRRAEKRRRKEEEEKARAEEQARALEGVVEGLEGDADMEQGAVGFEDDERMEDRGDVEYGDEVEDEDDEPDKHDEEIMEEK